MSAGTRSERERSCEEAHFLLLMKHFTNGHFVPEFLCGEGRLECCGAPCEHPEPTHTPGLRSGALSTSGWVSFAFPSSIGDFWLVGLVNLSVIN